MWKKAVSNLSTNFVFHISSGLHILLLWFYLWAFCNILLVPSLINELNNTYIYIYIYFYESWFYLSKNRSFNSSKTQWVRIWKFVCGFYPVLRQSSFHYLQLASSLLLFLNVNANVIFVIHLEKDLTKFFYSPYGKTY